CSATNAGVDGGGSDVRATDVSADGPAARCAPGVDSDGDGIPNDEECRIGSDPFNRDTDGDGIPDGVEAMYPRECVATERAAQRRPPPACTTDLECATGERCLGLDPASSDSDGDGVPDGVEDPNRDGTISTATGETDPRLWDTDGDGLNDSMGGIEICRPAGLATVTLIPVPSSPIQVGHDPAWGVARTVTGTMNRNAVIVDDATLNVAGAVFSMLSIGDVSAEAASAETAITTALGAVTSAVLVGRTLTTHDMNPAITSTYRVARATSASALRDALVMPLIGVAAPAGPGVVGTSTEFLVDITTTRRTMGAATSHTDVIVTIAPRTDYEDSARATSIRAGDLANTTGVAEVDAILGSDCQVFTADREAMADFLMTVDVSLSMGPHQQRVGQTAQRFFGDLHTAGVDFRVAVLAAHRTFDFVAPGLAWVESTNAMGATELAYRVTVGQFSGMAADHLWPYSNNGALESNTGEEPIAAGIAAYELLNAGSMTGAAPALRLRAGAQTVAFFIADETGSNDDTRYFAADAARWGTTYPMRLANAINFYRTNHIMALGLVNTTAAPSCDMTAPQDMRRCVILGSGGAWIPIDAERVAAIERT
ncbi:MAG: hypothetical protein WCJ30_24155, partial [Deltaproteobacteria bacterium]